MDAPAQTRLRRALLPRLPIRAVRTCEDDVAPIVKDALRGLTDQGSPADSTQHFAQPISAAVHCLVLGVPDVLSDDFIALFVE